MNKATEKEISDFLVDLRDSGVTNMFGAGPYLSARFGMTPQEAKEALLNWMTSYSQ